MNKKLAVLAAIALLAVALFAAYSYAEAKAKQQYANSVNHCRENMHLSEKDFESYPKARECVEAGGCFVTCGSGCGLRKSSIDVMDVLGAVGFHFRGGESICPAMCSSGCLYPLE